MKRLVATGAAALLVATVLTMTVVSPAAADSPYRGFSVPGDGTAVGSWIGARRAGKSAPVYRYQVRKAPVASAYRKARRVTTSKRRMQRVAFIASKYGDRIRQSSPEARVQAAAVDAAILHLAEGGKWRIGKARGARRINRTPYPQHVRSWAKQTLKDSKRHAGPYTQTVGRVQAATGSVATVKYSIRSRATRRGVARIPVVFRYGSHSHRTLTNEDGVARATFTTLGGTKAVTVKALKVPGSALRVRQPKNKRASAVLVAGARRTLKATGTLRGVSVQNIVVENSTSSYNAGQSATGTYTISGASGSQSVTRQLFGPLPSSATACSGAKVHESVVSGVGNGSHTLPPVVVQDAGWYRWSVRAAGNAATKSASACGAAFQVESAVQRIGMSDSDAVRMVGQRLNGSYTVNGGTGTRSMTRRLRGPLTTTPTCSTSATYWGPSSVDASGGSFTHPFPAHTATQQSGYYQWFVHAGANPGSDPTQGCGSLVRVMKQSTVTQDRTTPMLTNIGQDIDVKITLSGFDRSEARTVYLRMYGPFTHAENVNCNSSRRFRTIGISMNTNSTTTITTRVGASSNTGHYVFQTTNPDGRFIKGGTTGCGQRVNVRPR